MQRAGFTRVFWELKLRRRRAYERSTESQNRGNLLESSGRVRQNHGMEVMAGFIVGFDNDPDDIF